MEVDKKETICVGLHLRAQHRQAVYNETADLGEPCSVCPNIANCKSGGKYLWVAVYKKLCSEANIDISFREGQHPLVPLHKQDIHKMDNKQAVNSVETSAIAKNIKKYRKIKGYTQKSLAAALGLSESTIQKYESGAVSPTFSTLFKLADVLDINAEELITTQSSNPAGEIYWIEEDNLRDRWEKSKYAFVLDELFNIYSTTTDGNLKVQILTMLLGPYGF